MANVLSSFNDHPRDAPVTGSTPAPAPRPDLLPPEDEIHVLELLGVLVEDWKVLVAVPLAAGIVVAVYSMFVPHVYTASTSFLPEQSAQAALPAGLAGLANQFGVALGGGAASSPRVYAEILRSREITSRVLAARYAFGAGADSAALPDLLKIEGETPRVRLERGIVRLKSVTNISVDIPTGVVRLTVDAPQRELAAQIANRFIAELDEFNSETRQSAARNRRRFIGGRIVEAESALRSTEGVLRQFYDRNRQWQSSPQLVFEEGRLRRAVDLRQEVYLTLARENEKARIEEVNDMAAITVIDGATPPLLRSRPRRKVMVMVAMVLGALGAGVWLVGRRFLARARSSGSGGYQRFSAALARMRGDVRRLARAGGGSRGA